MLVVAPVARAAGESPSPLLVVSNSLKFNSQTWLGGRLERRVGDLATISHNVLRAGYPPNPP